MVPWKWSDYDKRRFDTTGRGPCWVGMLGNDIPMISIVTMWAHWDFGNVPVECPPTLTLRINEAHPCIVICTPFNKELGHETSVRWVVPSELTPRAHSGEIKGGYRQAHRGPWILKRNIGIEKLTVQAWDLHNTLNQFFTGPRQCHIGHGQVEIDCKNYLRNIKDYKVHGRVFFKQCMSGHSYGATRRVTDA